MLQNIVTKYGHVKVEAGNGTNSIGHTVCG